jgi:hypothetical protein
MARTTLTVQTIVRAGLTPSYAAANADGHALPNTGRECVHVKTGGTACTVTVQTPTTVDGLAVAERTIAIGTTSERFIGPFPRATYNQGAEAVYLDFSAVTSVTIAALKLPS